jgi:methyltransferase (TIGR00027 family)
MTEGASWDITTGIGSTALSVAAFRAIEAGRPQPLVKDPYGAAFVLASGVPLPTTPEAADSDAGFPWPAFSTYLAVRSRFFDSFLAAAAATGIRQAVILGAGLDTRAFRLDWPEGTTVYEIDAPPVLDFKDAVLADGQAQPGCTRRTVPADLRQDWPAALRAAGFDPAQPTAWLAEGLVVYLTDEGRARLLTAISDLSAPGSQAAIENSTQGNASLREYAVIPQAAGQAGIEFDPATVYAEDPGDDLAGWLASHGWLATIRPAAEVAGQYGRPLSPVLPETMRTAIFITARAPGTNDNGNGSLPGLDSGVANAARMWNYWIGGKDHFRADREAGDYVLEAMPALPYIARTLRRFLTTTVDELTAAGVRQFLDIGSGLPTADNTHEVAQRAAPESRIVYVDHDPVVIRQARALLTSSPAGRTDYIQADLRDWETISAGARRTLDFSRPVAVLLIAVLHFILDTENPHEIISRIAAGLAPGSYLIIAHAASDIEADTAAAMARSYNATASLTITPRDRATVARFFDGMEMTGPGLIPVAQLAGSSPDSAAARGLSCYCGIARKP